MNKNLILKIKEVFETRFQKDPLLIKSPGRINLIGEHTDYNNGFVLPAAVNKAMYFAIKPNHLGRFRFIAFDLNDAYETPVNQIQKSQKHWANYLLGVIAQFVKKGISVLGFDCVFGGDVPLGAGMSSSAAIACGLATAINHLNQFEFSTLSLAKFAQLAEHEYAGVQCGIMDQFASLHGQVNQLIKLDCRSLAYELFPFNMDNYMLILVNTGVKHALASSAYNQRRQECEEGVQLLQQIYPEVQSLRDAQLEMIDGSRSHFSENVYKRCTYVIEENIRVNKACSALLASEYKTLGQLMYESHKGLQEKFEVSCPELDQLVALASNMDGVTGSRMMGGGFGGCTINLVENRSAAQFKAVIKKQYKTPEQTEPQIIEVVIDQGTHFFSDY